MAAAQSPGLANLVPSNSKFRSKNVIFAVLAGALVFAYFFFAREGGILPMPEETVVASEQAPGPATIFSPVTKETVTVTVTTSPSPTTEQGVDLARPGGSETSWLSPSAPRAVIIETSIIANLIPIMLHFSNVLGLNWGMTLFTLEENWTEPLSPVFQRALTSGRIEIRFLPEDVELTSSRGVSIFLTQPWIWEQLASAERVLLFQADSIICTKSEDIVDNYFMYDFVGAPIDAKYGQGYNGGLSIRNPRLFLEVVKETDFLTSGAEFEDQFFYKKLKEKNAEMPAEEIAKRFSVETVYYETPLGYHQPQRWQANNMRAIETWCPEVKMLIGRRAT
ncbi:hypothetical protein N0V93_008797 [Gnomoniopsis smithogilvyi]|uniref:DUF5672 domain-containing protein n=1 Tax=Gnomoniopsis smithogilvyi TaxID=1191159 RepID=A0A9W8YMC4_9PEZI|nr:hypothetical protein N0V93_008797 [Gnomoniopsis smithogilvyi]